MRASFLSLALIVAAVLPLPEQRSIEIADQFWESRMVYPECEPRYVKFTPGDPVWTTPIYQDGTYQGTPAGYFVPGWAPTDPCTIKLNPRLLHDDLLYRCGLVVHEEGHRRGRPHAPKYDLWNVMHQRAPAPWECARERRSRARGCKRKRSRKARAACRRRWAILEG